MHIIIIVIIVVVVIGKSDFITPSSDDPPRLDWFPGGKWMYCVRPYALLINGTRRASDRSSCVFTFPLRFDNLEQRQRFVKEKTKFTSVRKIVEFSRTYHSFFRPHTARETCLSISVKQYYNLHCKTVSVRRCRRWHRFGIFCRLIPWHARFRPWRLKTYLFLCLRWRKNKSGSGITSSSLCCHTGVETYAQTTPSSFSKQYLRVPPDPLLSYYHRPEMELAKF